VKEEKILLPGSEIYQECGSLQYVEDTNSHYRHPSTKSNNLEQLYITKVMWTKKNYI